ncbi:MAG: hypothetical protein H7Y60_11015 [Rhodospirillaceae bacterium]|nr:hypothetical protein [Rhodospirillales bacterium]
MTRKIPTHLRVVWNKDAAEKKVFARRNPVQLDLLIGREENQVAFVCEGVLTGTLMLELLQTLQPHYLLDLRSCPRLDLLGYSRKKAFSDFHRWGAKYYCLSSEEASAEIPEQVRMLTAKLEQDLRGPLLVIVDRDETIEQLSRFLTSRPTTRKAEWKFSVSGMPPAPAENVLPDHNPRRLALVAD